MQDNRFAISNCPTTINSEPKESPICVRIEGISHKGEGVGRINGKAAFIPFAIPGELVTVEIIEEKKRFIRAQILEVLEPSADRVVPKCPHYFECGGCALQHMTYNRQLKLKRRIVQDQLQRIGRLDCEVLPVIGMEDPWRYRNKVKWHLQKKDAQIQMGYFKDGSHELVDIKTCKLITAPMEKLSRLLKQNMRAAEIGKKASLVIRQSSADNSMLAVLNNLSIEFTNNQDFPGLKTVYQQRNQKLEICRGTPGFHEQINSTRYDLSPLAFFQVNTVQTQKLYELIIQLAQPNPDDILLDAFCGSGTIALYLAPHVKKVTGVESYAPAIQDARKNAALNDIQHSEFIAGPCEKVIPELKEHFDIVILDPPRAGCKPELIQTITQKSPRCIIYVSCNPSTLARDLAIFNAKGYQINLVQPLDMFPQTGHVETICLMSKE